MGILVFISYATKDAETFQIPFIAEVLTECPEIEDVLYWQEDLQDDIYAYMNENVGKCDVFVLFCSPNALESVPVGKEWMAAEALNKPIIPVFTSVEHIPPLLRPKLGIQIDVSNMQDTIKKLRRLILKKAPKTQLGVDLQFKLPKNLSHNYHVDKKSSFIIPLLQFCMENNLSIKNILITTEKGERVSDEYIDETVQTVTEKFGTAFRVMPEKMQVVANFKICMVGDEKSGKSSLLHYCIECEYEEEYLPTVGVDYYVKLFTHKSFDKNFDITLLFWDLAGSFDQFDEVQLGLFQETDGFFFVADLTNKASFTRIESYWLPNIRKNIERDVPFILLVNKADLKPVVSKKYVEHFIKRLKFNAVFYTSAKTGDNVELAFKSIIAPILTQSLEIL
ncbi:MAG: GTP-binding protein [Candidatus Helarchaeota archaeon]